MAQFRFGRIATAYLTLGRAILRAFTNREVMLLFSLTTLVAVGGALVFMLLEDWGFVDALYFAVVSMATVGYGDLSPMTNLGKLFTIAFLVVGIGLFVLTVAAVAEAILSELRRPRDGS
jgi:hypothetical protein